MKTLGRSVDTSAESLDRVRAEVGPIPIPMPTMEQKTVLLVDDDASILTLCSTLLREEGFTVLPASGSQEALQICQQYPGPIHLLISDIVLAPPTLQLKKNNHVIQRDVNGVQLMRQIMSFRQGIKVILMSGHSDERIESLYILKEGIPFLRKPFSIETLARMIRQTLASQSE